MGERANERTRERTSSASDFGGGWRERERERGAGAGGMHGRSTLYTSRCFKTSDRCMHNSAFGQMATASLKFIQCSWKPNYEKVYEHWPKLFHLYTGMSLEIWGHRFIFLARLNGVFSTPPRSVT